LNNKYQARKQVQIVRKHAASLVYVPAGHSAKQVAIVMSRNMLSTHDEQALAEAQVLHDDAQPEHKHTKTKVKYSI
jgi:hypothetical protein